MTAKFHLGASVPGSWCCTGWVTVTRSCHTLLVLELWKMSRELGLVLFKNLLFRYEQRSRRMSLGMNLLEIFPLYTQMDSL